LEQKYKFIDSIQ